MDQSLQLLRRAAAGGEHGALFELARALERAGLFETWTIQRLEAKESVRGKSHLVLSVINEFGHPRTRVFDKSEYFVRDLVPAAIGTDVESNDLIGADERTFVGLRVRAFPRVGAVSLTKVWPVVHWRFEAEDGKPYRYSVSPPQIDYGD